MAVKSVINLWRLEEGNSGFSLYEFSQMKGATNGFSIDNKLGQGGFGIVYKVLFIMSSPVISNLYLFFLRKYPISIFKLKDLF